MFLQNLFYQHWMKLSPMKLSPIKYDKECQYLRNFDGEDNLTN